MARQITISHERILFPAWSVTTDSLHETFPTRRRRYQRLRTLGVRVGILVCVTVLVYLLIIRKGHNTDEVLGGKITKQELDDLHLTSFKREEVANGNPWRGAGRRTRSDVIVSVSGCGGTMRPAISEGDVAVIRYCIRDNSNTVVDSSIDTAGVAVGSGQVGIEIERALIGLCAGEIARFKTRHGRTILVYVERVGDEKDSEEEREEDRLAGIVKASAGRRGRNCRTTCRARGLVCKQNGFLVVNNCPRLRAAFNCARCEVAAVGSGGPDMPAFVVSSAPKGHARGVCLVSPSVHTATCEAKYEFTRRLCPCFESTL